MARTQKKFLCLRGFNQYLSRILSLGRCPLLPRIWALPQVYIPVEDTWWMQVIRALQGRLLSNLSISGNTISTAGTMGGFPRVELHSLPSMASRQTTSFSMPGSTTPIFMCRQKGSSGNTSSCSPVFGKPIPHAQISCGTLILGAVPGTQGSLSCLVQRLAPYNQAIRSAVAQADCQLVDLAAMHSRYDALDAFHPNGTGMAQLARLWLQGMEASS